MKNDEEEMGKYDSTRGESERESKGNDTSDL